MAKKTKPRLGRGLSSLMGTPVRVDQGPRMAAPEAPGEPREAREAAGSAPGRGGGGEPAGAAASENVGAETPEAGGNGERGAGRLVFVRVSEVSPGRYQPRRSAEGPGLEGLAASIRASGVIQPIAVRRVGGGDGGGSGGGWELIAGERRWRAAQIAGLETIPAVVVELSDQEAAEWGLVENVQREDLTPIERGEALRRLADEFGLSQSALGERVGLDRSSVANLMRLVELEDPIRRLIEAGPEGGGLSSGHGKALLGIPSDSRGPNGAVRVRLAERAAREGWSVRKLEQAVRVLIEGGAIAGVTDGDGRPAGGGVGGSGGGSGGGEGADREYALALMRQIEQQMSEQFSTRVRLRTDKTGKRGSMTLDFYDLDHFEGLVRKMGVRLDL